MPERPEADIDLLAWFGEQERTRCRACGEDACAPSTDGLSSFCLACGAMWIDGARVDGDGTPEDDAPAPAARPRAGTDGRPSALARWLPRLISRGRR